MNFQYNNTFTKAFSCFLLFLLGLMSASVTHAGYIYVDHWGGSGQGDGQFYHPRGIAVDSDGYVYVTDSGNNRVQKFSKINRLHYYFVLSFGNGQLKRPVGIAVNNSGYVYVADSGTDRFVVFDESGKYYNSVRGEGVGAFPNPEGIAVDSSGNVYVTSMYSDLIAKYYRSNFVTSIRSLDSPKGVAVDKYGYLYAADGDNDCVVKLQYDPPRERYTPVATIGSSGTGEGELHHPIGVAVDSSGNIYVVDNGNNRVQKFSSSDGINYHFASYVGDPGSAKRCSPGSLEGQFNNPEGVAVDSQGIVFVADTYNNRVQMFYECPPGTDSYILDSKWVCLTGCPERYEDHGDHVCARIRCPFEWYKVNGKCVCLECPPGTQSYLIEGKKECLECPPGTQSYLIEGKKECLTGCPENYTDIGQNICKYNGPTCRFPKPRCPNGGIPQCVDGKWDCGTCRGQPHQCPRGIMPTCIEGKWFCEPP